jgi:hypothetical protein
VIRAEQLAEYASGPFLAACALLVCAGAAKLRSSRRALGFVEIAVGGSGAATGRGGAVVVAALYLALAAYALRLLVTAPGAPCNCLGARTAPVAVAHVGLDIGAALVAVAGAFGPSPLTGLADQPLAGVPYLVLTACCLWLGALFLGAYPELRGALSGQRGLPARQGGS